MISLFLLRFARNPLGRLRKEVKRDDRQAFKSDDFDSCVSERAFKALSLTL